MDNRFYDIIAFRKKLHQHPELSKHEAETARRVKKFIAQFKPDDVVDAIGGHGIAFIFNGLKEGPTVMLRSELDALPIAETNDMPYRSVYDNVSHKCGHDGHMAILSAVASILASKRPPTGRVVLLFQPAEETGTGAELVVNDPKFKQLSADYVFALHNLPGYESSSIIVSDSTFASASKGMLIKLHGKTSHAGEPERGINPAQAVANILNHLLYLPQNKEFADFVLITIVHVKLGEIAFGTSAGYAEIRATLRAYQNPDMEQLTQKSEEFIRHTARNQKLEVEISYTEEFPATVNHPEASEIVRHAATDAQLAVVELKQPFRWSEDFAHFTLAHQGALFGLGAGTKQPQLHNPDYDFPDKIIESGAEVFHNIINIILRP